MGVGEAGAAAAGATVLPSMAEVALAAKALATVLTELARPGVKVLDGIELAISSEGASDALDSRVASHVVITSWAGLTPKSVVSLVYFTDLESPTQPDRRLCRSNHSHVVIFNSPRSAKGKTKY